MRGFVRASQLDPSLPAATHIENIHRFLHKAHTLISRKARIKPKRLESLLKEFSDVSADSSRLPAGSVMKLLSELKEGPNPGCVLHLQLVTPITRASDSDVPVTFAVFDKSGEFCAISMYNMAGTALDRLKEKDRLLIVEPVFKRIVLPPTANQEAVSYPCLHVLHPDSLIVNNKSLARTLVAAPELKLDNFS
eukprot:TRINITY_DN8581_c0_g1_i9.p1 TRINITY_DN8581_c0_g1~~TRINITY_DN8581_c0_g1_i9.p1  ORF type:complete len:193 (+),score=26.01 TRINITY_DN8581_c0_g1_i9:217-795(+)